MTNIQNTIEFLISENEEEQIFGIQQAIRQYDPAFLPYLLQRVEEPHVGYFVTEGLAVYGQAIVPDLRHIMQDEANSLLIRARAAQILLDVGDQSGIPILLEAIYDPNFNQTYLGYLEKFAPTELADHVIVIIRNRFDECITVKSDLLDDYFAKLLWSLLNIHEFYRIIPELKEIADNSSGWRLVAIAKKSLLKIGKN